MPDLADAQAEIVRLRAEVAQLRAQPKQESLPRERASITKDFLVGNSEAKLIISFYPDGRPGEIFLSMGKQGSVMAGFCEAFAMAISLALQHGVPAAVLVEKFRGCRFDPMWYTGEPLDGQQSYYATSVIDYVATYLGEVLGRSVLSSGGRQV